MKKFFTTIMAFMLIVPALMFVGCGPKDQTETQTPGTKQLQVSFGRKYCVGMNFADGLPVVEVVEGSTKTAVSSASYNVTGFNSETAGTKQVTVSYNGLNVTKPVEVLSVDNYVSYIKTETIDNITSTSNLNLEAATLPTAELNFDLNTIQVIITYSDNIGTRVYSNQSVCLLVRFDADTIIEYRWLDKTNKTIYVKTLDTSTSNFTYTKATYPSLTDAAIHLLDDNVQNGLVSETLTPENLQRYALSFVDLDLSYAYMILNNGGALYDIFNDNNANYQVSVTAEGNVKLANGTDFVIVDKNFRIVESNNLLYNKNFDASTLELLNSYKTDSNFNH